MAQSYENTPQGRHAADEKYIEHAAGMEASGRYQTYSMDAEPDSQGGLDALLDAAAETGHSQDKKLARKERLARGLRLVYDNLVTYSLLYGFTPDGADLQGPPSTPSHAGKHRLEDAHEDSWIVLTLVTAYGPSDFKLTPSDRRDLTYLDSESFDIPYFLEATKREVTYEQFLEQAPRVPRHEEV